MTSLIEMMMRLCNTIFCYKNKNLTPLLKFFSHSPRKRYATIILGGVTIKSLIKKRYDMVKVESKWIKNKRNIGYIGDKIYLPDTFLSASFYFQGDWVKVVYYYMKQLCLYFKSGPTSFQMIQILIFFIIDQIMSGLIFKPNKQNYCDDFDEQVHSECTGLMANKTLVLYSQIVLLSLFKPVLFLSLS